MNSSCSPNTTVDLGNVIVTYKVNSDWISGFEAGVVIENKTSAAIKDWKLSFDLDHPIYDCIYLALARQRRLPLITADKRFISKLDGQDLAIPVIELFRFMA